MLNKSNMLNIDMKRVDDKLYIALEGRVNTVTAKELAHQLEPEMANLRGAVFDLAKLDYISSAGLRVIIRLQQHMQKVGGETVCVRNANEMVADTLAMAGFGGVINIE